MNKLYFLLLLGPLLLGSCRGASVVAGRPYALAVPASYDPARPVPLVLVLHGYGSSAEETRRYFHFDEVSDRHSAIFAFPNGTRDRLGRRFWNATDACCNFYGVRVDDVAYLSEVIADVGKRYRIDRQRVYVVGHSNGGFMATRLACDRAGLIAAFADLAGANWRDPSRCRPREPVAALHVHGDQDPVVRYGGGDLRALADEPPAPPAPYPSVRESLGVWLRRNGCNPTPDNTEVAHGFDSKGRDNYVERWRTCRGAPVELWTIHGGGHNMDGTPAFGEGIWEFLAAQHKP